MEERRIADERPPQGSTQRHFGFYRPEPLGRKTDEAKARYDLIPAVALQAVVDVLTYGAEKYAPDNWRHVPQAESRYLAAGLRHVFAFMRGEPCDPESGQHHLAHAACCVLFLLEKEIEQ